MKILVASDTHSKNNTLIAAIREEMPLDLVIHLGDLETSESLREIDNSIPVHVARHFVLGNNDIFMKLDSSKEIPLGKHHKAFITHGHRFGVGLRLEELRDEAYRRGCDIAMFGHTHKIYYEELDGVLLINPGSISYPRGEERRKSYAILHIDEGNKEVDVRFKFV